MSWKFRVAAVAGAMAVVLSACGPAGEPTLYLTARPRTIDPSGTSEVTVTATGADGQPGTGTVRLSSPSGTFRTPKEVMLSAGMNDEQFGCENDPDCMGSVRITAEWVVNGKLIQATTNVTVVAPDSGTGGGGGGVGDDAGMDAGMDDAGTGGGGGSMDAGLQLDGGTFDGGMTGVYRVDVVGSDKATLLEATTDSAIVTFRVSTNTQTPVPVEATMVSLTLNSGSFAAGSAVLSTTAMTDSQGLVQVQVYVDAAVRDTTINVQASALDAANTARIRVVKVETLTWKSDSSTKTTLTIRSTGMGFSSPVYFEVRAPDGKVIEGVDVTFSVAPNSAAGSSVAPTSDRSNAMGIVHTTLTAGDSQGTVTVLARVSGLPDVSSTPFNVVIGRPSDERLAVSCSRITLGALEISNPPRNDISITCRTDFTDRNGVRTPYVVAVSWYSEAGQVSPVSNAAASSGFATTPFTTGGSLPVETQPLPGEPTNGTRNPRDNFVTIIASMSGEEQFWDGSGSSNGVTNGKWDPGEYFVDLPEPFADSNDNGVWDPGEPWGDTDRIDCATGQILPKNGQWDPPNGCWDANTQIWRATHVVYSAALVDNPSSQYIRFTPALPSVIAPQTALMVDFDWFDPWFNRLSNDSPMMSLTRIAGTRGSISLSPRLGGESTGHSVTYTTIRGTQLDGGSFSDDGPCDFTQPDAGYPATRCLRTTKFEGWMTSPTGGRLTITGAMPQGPLSDGGIQPPTPASYEMRSSNSLQALPSTYPFIINFE